MQQSFKDFEFLVASPERLKQEVGEVMDNMDYKFIGTPPLQDWQVWDLNYSYNRLIEASSGELIVSWQDHTYAKEKLLETLWKRYQENPLSLVSVLGDKYPDWDFDIPNWIDPRKTMLNTGWHEVEWNLCSCPKKLLYDIGGFDEQMDSFFGMDGYNVNQRLSELVGIEFKLERNMETYSLNHGRVEDWDKKNGLFGPYQQHIEKRKREGKWPKLDYLKK